MREGWINIEKSYFEDSLELAKQQEQERIIKLLNELSEELYCTQKLQNAGLNMRCNHYWQEIALIRGEGKL